MQMVRIDITQEILPMIEIQFLEYPLSSKDRSLEVIMYLPLNVGHFQVGADLGQILSSFF